MAMHQTDTGKRVRECLARVEEIPVPVVETPEYKIKNFIRGLVDRRFHVTANMGEYKFKVLIDSGATNSYIGAELFERIKKENKKIHAVPLNTTSTLADRTKSRIISTTDIKIEIVNVKRVLTVGIIPTLTSTCIIGIDGLEKFGMNVDFDKKWWGLAEKPGIKYYMYDIPEQKTTQTHPPDTNTQTQTQTNTQTYPPDTNTQTKTNAQIHSPGTSTHENNREITEQKCSGIHELTPIQFKEIRQTVQEKLTRPPGQLGLTHLSKHRINVNGHPGIKQRNHMVSPKIREAIYEEVEKMLKEGIIEPSESEWSNSHDKKTK